MKRIDQIMKEMGFNKEAPDSVKEAFIKHLIRASEGVHVATPSEKNEIKQSAGKVKPLFSFEKEIRQSEQMSFDFIEQKSFNPKSKKTKIG